MNCINNGTMAAMAAALAANSSMTSDKTQMHLYLDRLKSMVPQCPKNRKVSRQELIEHVIDYISDLQDTLQSDSDSDSPPGSPMDDVSFSDSFDQQPQYGGYGLQPDQYSAQHQGYYPDSAAHPLYQDSNAYQQGYEPLNSSYNNGFDHYKGGFNSGNYGGYSANYDSSFDRDSRGSPVYSSSSYSMS